MTNTDAARILTKPCISSRKEHLWEENWFAKRPDTWSLISPNNQIIHLYTPRGHSEIQTWMKLRTTGFIAAVRTEQLAKRVLKLSVTENRPAGWEFSLGRLAKFMGCSPPLKAGLLAWVAVVPLRRWGNWAPENWYSLQYRGERKRGLWRELKLKILIYIELVC